MDQVEAKTTIDQHRWPGATCRILLIDDEPVLRATFKYLLEAEGYQVSVASDGESGLEMFARSHYDLVITDLVMPGIDGFATIDLLRKQRQDLPIIAMSAYLTPEEMEHPLRRGALCYVTKPVEIPILTQIIEAILISGPRDCEDEHS